MTSVPEDLCGHDEAGRFWADLDVARQEPHVSEGVLKVSELLVGQRFNWRGVDGPVTAAHESQNTERMTTSGRLQIKCGKCA